MILDRLIDRERYIDRQRKKERERERERRAGEGLRENLLKMKQLTCNVPHTGLVINKVFIVQYSTYDIFR